MVTKFVDICTRGLTKSESPLVLLLRFFPTKGKLHELAGVEPKSPVKLRMARNCPGACAPEVGLQRVTVLLAALLFQLVDGISNM